MRQRQVDQIGETVSMMACDIPNRRIENVRDISVPTHIASKGAVSRGQSITPHPSIAISLAGCVLTTSTRANKTPDEQLHSNRSSVTESAVRDVFKHWVAGFESP